MSIRYISSDYANGNDDVGDTIGAGGAKSKPQVPVVDDECIMLAAATPRIMDASIDVVLNITTKTFNVMKLEFSWKPGKTECFLVYRGKRAGVHYKARRSDGEGDLVVKVSGKLEIINVAAKY